jgi:hypothetical protein
MRKYMAFSDLVTWIVAGETAPETYVHGPFSEVACCRKPLFQLITMLVPEGWTEDWMVTVVGAELPP